MQPDSNNARVLTPADMYWLITGTVMCILPHSQHLPIWIILLSLTLISVRLVLVLRKKSVPAQLIPHFGILQTGLVITGFIGVFAYFHTLVGRDAGTALLVMLAGFKIMETYSERDFYIANFIGLFVIITNFFYTQSIIIAVYMTLTVLIMLSALISFNGHRDADPMHSIRTAAIMLFQALPVMLVLFLLFPRINGPLWGLPKDAHAGLIGISDDMEPGSISRLIRSNAVAFRVEFNGEIPPHNKLYWRGPVLWNNDGRKWTREPVIYAETPRVEVTGTASHYSITMEPSNKRWLFALEMPLQFPANGYISYDYQLLAHGPVRQRIRYELSSFTNYRLDASDNYELQRGLQFPLHAHKKTIALARSWRAEAKKPVDIINRALRMFNEEEFYYTLSPPLLGVDNVDDFLFGTRQGFCEHYAAAFVALMRAAGIPARVVTGYQGGIFNPIGNYLIVYQRDAHAWAEVWLEDQGWIRVDPTSAVSPARVEQGIQEALPEDVIDIPGVFNQNLFSRDLWERMHNTWDAINNQWNQWFISYGPERQIQFMKQFGLKQVDYGLLTILLLFFTGLLLLIIAFLLFKKRPATQDPARRIYDSFCKKLSGINIQHMSHEGPLDFAKRVSLKKRVLAKQVNHITALYIQVRYGSHIYKLQELENQVNIFNPKKMVRSLPG